MNDAPKINEVSNVDGNTKANEATKTNISSEANGATRTNEVSNVDGNTKANEAVKTNISSETNSATKINEVSTDDGAAKANEVLNVNEATKLNETSNINMATIEDTNPIIQIAMNNNNVPKTTTKVNSPLNNNATNESQTIDLDFETIDTFDTKFVNNASNNIKTISNSPNLDKLTLSEQVQNIKNTLGINVNTTEQAQVKINNLDTEVSIAPNQVDNNNQLNIANDKTNKINQEHLETQTSTPSSTDASTDDGITATPTITGATKDSSGNPTGQEDKQDNTQKNINFEPTAQHKEENAITGTKTESTFAEYDKRGYLRMDDIPRYVNRVVT